MKEFVEYFYGLEIHKIEKETFNTFKIDEGKYVLKKINEDAIDRVLESISLAQQFGEKYHEPIYNKNGELFSNINGEYYILLKNIFKTNRKIGLTDLSFPMTSSTVVLKNSMPGENWKELWIKKIDLLEEWVEGKNNSLKKDKYIIEYYIGLSEMALSFLIDTLIIGNVNSKNQYNMVIQHYRLHESDTLITYYDPTNILLDHIGRDIGEYIKDIIINGNFQLETIKLFFDNKSFSNYDIRLIYVRIIFPSFFFDYFEEIFNNGGKLDIDYLQRITLNYEKGISLISTFFKEQYGFGGVI